MEHNTFDNKKDESESFMRPRSHAMTWKEVEERDGMEININKDESESFMRPRSNAMTWKEVEERDCMEIVQNVQNGDDVYRDETLNETGNNVNPYAQGV